MRDRQINALRAQLTRQEQRITVLFEQAQRDAYAHIIAESNAVALQTARFQEMMSEFHSEMATSCSAMQRQGDQYKEQLRTEMHHELEASMQSVTMQARTHVEHAELAAAKAANSTATQARAQV